MHRNHRPEGYSVSTLQVVATPPISRNLSDAVIVVSERENWLKSKREVPNDVHRKLYDGDKMIELPRSYVVQHKLNNRGIELNHDGIRFSSTLIDALALSKTEIEDLWRTPESAGFRGVGLLIVGVIVR